MADHKAVLTDKAPKPIPQLSQAVKYNGMVYCSGSLGVDPATGKFAEGSVKDRTVGIIILQERNERHLLTRE